MINDIIYDEKSATSRGICREAYDGMKRVEICTESFFLPIDESILWLCGASEVVSLSLLCTRYYRAYTEMEREPPDVADVYDRLRKKGLIAVGSGTYADALFSLYSACLPVIADKRMQAIPYPDYMAFLKENTFCCFSKKMDFSVVSLMNIVKKSITSDLWMLPEIVRNIDMGYPPKATRNMVYKWFSEGINETDAIKLFIENEEKLLPRYAGTTLARNCAEAVNLLYYRKEIMLL